MVWWTSRRWLPCQRKFPSQHVDNFSRSCFSNFVFPLKFFLLDYWIFFFFFLKILWQTTFTRLNVYSYTFADTNTALHLCGALRVSSEALFVNHLYSAPSHGAYGGTSWVSNTTHYDCFHYHCTQPSELARHFNNFNYNNNIGDIDNDDIDDDDDDDDADADDDDDDDDDNDPDSTQACLLPSNQSIPQQHLLNWR